MLPPSTGQRMMTMMNVVLALQQLVIAAASFAFETSPAPKPRQQKRATMQAGGSLACVGGLHACRGLAARERPAEARACPHKSEALTGGQCLRAQSIMSTINQQRNSLDMPPQL